MTRFLIPLLPFALAVAAPFLAAYAPIQRSDAADIAPVPDAGFLPALDRVDSSDFRARPALVG